MPAFTAVKRKIQSLPVEAEQTAEDQQWECGQCGNMNYGNRILCNMRKCGAPRSEEHWFCPSCGNENYAARMFCNMKKCGVARPGLTKTAVQQTMFKKLKVAAPQAGPVAGNGPESFPPAWTCKLCSNQNFAGRTTCNAKKCGAPYATAADKRPVGKGTTKGAAGIPVSIPAWTCFACGNQNFAGRAVCNSNKCGAPFPGQMMKTADQGLPKPGSWICTACSNVNYPTRSVCNARSCGQPRELVDGGYPKSGNASQAPQGSWTCKVCNNVNWPNRTECNARGCGAART